MAGETDLTRMLAHLQPHLSAVEYAFATLEPGTALPTGISPIGSFQEHEGLTIIAPAAQFAGQGVEVLAKWALITLRVHSSLQAVGLMAAVAQALADAGISVNPVAGFHHDHLFVPWARRDEALQILEALSDQRKLSA
jgi:hypothetical protein